MYYILQNRSRNCQCKRAFNVRNVLHWIYSFLVCCSCLNYIFLGMSLGCLWWVPLFSDLTPNSLYFTTGILSVMLRRKALGQHCFEMFLSNSNTRIICLSRDSHVVTSVSNIIARFDVSNHWHHIKIRLL